MTWTIDPYALITLDNAKQHLDIPSATTSEDDIITRFINSASQAIENYTDRKFKKRSHTEIQDGRGQDRIVLRHFPCFKPSELWIDQSGEFTDVTNKIAITDYALDGLPEKGIGVVLYNRRFSVGRSNIKIIYEAGYDPIPMDLQEACFWMIDFYYDMRSDRRIGLSSKGKQSENTSFRDDFPPFVKNILNKYQRYEFPDATFAIESSR